MCRVTMCQSFVHQISSASLQKRTGVFSIEYYLASRTLLWAGGLIYFGGGYKHCQHDLADH